MTRIALVAASLSIALFACRGGDDGGDDSPNPDGPPPGGDVTIQEVQSDEMADGTAIELRGVVVTAIDEFGGNTGDIWVQEPDGGPFSGIKVFGAPLAIVANLEPGDIVDITNAEKEEFVCTMDICGGTFDPGLSITEVKGVGGGDLTITEVGTGAVPAPAVVDALAISMMTSEDARNAEWEKWEGVLITLTKARQLGGETTFGDDEEDEHQIPVTGPLSVQSSMTAFGAAAVPGTCFEGITGIGDFFFDYHLLPRSSSDLVGGGTECATLTTATIEEVQDGTATGFVQINDVYVTAVGYNRRNVWVSQGLDAAASEGLYLRASGTPATDVVVGARVSILGTAEEYNNDATGTTLTQVNFAYINRTAAPTTAPVPVTGQTVANLNAEGTGEPYEGVLVTLTNVKFSTAGASPDYIVTMTDSSGVDFKADDDIYRFVTADAGCYSSITGIWSYNIYENSYVFLPRKALAGAGPLGTKATNAADCD